MEWKSGLSQALEAAKTDGKFVLAEFFLPT
jgi:hypothetical protein